MRECRVSLCSLTTAFVILCASSASADPYEWFDFEGHSYALTSLVGTWTDAEDEAIEAGGHLVTINSLEENQFLADTFSVIYPGPDIKGAAWMGFVDQYEEGHWQWIGETENPGDIWDGGWWEQGNPESTSFSFWQPPQPDNNGNEDYGIMQLYFDGEWNDYLHDREPFIPGIIELPEPSSASLLLIAGIIGTTRRMKRRLSR